MEYKDIKTIRENIEIIEQNLEDTPNLADDTVSIPIGELVAVVREAIDAMENVRKLSPSPVQLTIEQIKCRVRPVWVRQLNKKTGEFGLVFRRADDEKDIGVRLLNTMVLGIKSYGKGWVAYDVPGVDVKKTDIYKPEPKLIMPRQSGKTNTAFDQFTDAVAKDMVKNGR